MVKESIKPIKISRTHITRNEIIISVIFTISVILLSIWIKGFFSVDDASTYLTIVGLIYGVFAAFAVQMVWERYNKIIDNLGEELTSLGNVYRLTKTLSDKKTIIKFYRKLVDYLRGCLSTSWDDFEEAKILEKQSEELFETLSKVETKGDAESLYFGACFEELRDANTARSHQLVLSTTPLPKIIWGLLIILSLSLVGGILFVVFEDNLLNILVKIIMSIASYSILVVIYHIDSLELSTEKVEEEPTKELILKIEKEILELEKKERESQKAINEKYQKRGRF